MPRYSRNRAERRPSIHLLGFVAYRAGRPQEAVDLIGKAIALDEKNPDCHFNIGLALLAAGRLAIQQERFPRGPAMTDLAGWGAFEADNPLTFTGMYQFWVQKQ